MSSFFEALSNAPKRNLKKLISSPLNMDIDLYLFLSIALYFNCVTIELSSKRHGSVYSILVHVKHILLFNFTLQISVSFSLILIPSIFVKDGQFAIDRQSD